MKRSEVNRILRDAGEFLDSRMFALPPWAYWGPKEWAEILGDPEKAKAHAEDTTVFHRCPCLRCRRGTA